MWDLGEGGWRRGRGRAWLRCWKAEAVAPSPWYLVVDHHVDSAVGGVGGQVAQMEGLVYDALASERGIPVQKDGHDLQTRKEMTDPVWPLEVKPQAAFQAMCSEIPPKLEGKCRPGCREGSPARRHDSIAPAPQPLPGRCGPAQPCGPTFFPSVSPQ